MPSYQIKIDLTFETEADSKDIVESLNTLFDESEDMQQPSPRFLSYEEITEYYDRTKGRF